MISYSKYGKHAGFEDAKSLQDLQTKAQKLRAKGFTIDKMGRYNPPVKKEDKDAFDPITENIVSMVNMLDRLQTSRYEEKR